MAATTYRPDSKRDAAALPIADGAGQWLKITLCVGVGSFSAGTKFYGVPSATTEGTTYFANLRYCSCKDYERRGQGCKHQRAVVLHIARVREAGRQQPQQQDGEAAASPTPAPARRRKPRRKVAQPAETVTAVTAGDTSALSATDVCRLTLFKWRYSLESAGFTAYEAEQLLFLKWRAVRQPIAP